MEILASYIRSVCTASMIVGILGCLFREDLHASGLLRLICGIFLLVVVIRPGLGLRFDALENFASESFLDAEAAAIIGVEKRQEDLAECIKEELETYILDKAEAMDTDLCVDVVLSSGDIPLPESVFLSGNCTTRVRENLTQVIASDLGIPKERQIWTVSPEKSG